MGSPTDEIRARLDEMGVEYTANDEEHVKETCWPYMGELMAVFAEYDNGTTRFACDTWCFTPEQAIAATVGAGTCTMQPDGYLDEQYGIYECSSCGEAWQFEYDGPKENGWKYCPHCRARIEEEPE